jgi:hypothetical protein
MLTPVAQTASKPSEWYVPYLGPAPYSFDVGQNPTYERTKKVSHASITSASLTLGDLSVTLTGVATWLLPSVTLLIELLTPFFKKEIGKAIAKEGQKQVNDAIDDIYSGKTRIE